MDILIFWGVGAKVGESVFSYMGDGYNSNVGARYGPVVRWHRSVAWALRKAIAWAINKVGYLAFKSKG